MTSQWRKIYPRVNYEWINQKGESSGDVRRRREPEEGDINHFCGNNDVLTFSWIQKLQRGWEIHEKIIPNDKDGFGRDLNKKYHSIISEIYKYRITVHI